LNILYLCDEYPPCLHGGIGSVTQTLARAVAQKGHKVVVAGFYPYYRIAAERENDRGVEVYRFFYGGKWNLRLSRHKIMGLFINIKNAFDKYVQELNNLVKLYKIDIIESPDFLEAFRYSGPQIIEFTEFGVPFVVKLHGSFSIVNDHTDKKYGNKNIFLKEMRLMNFAKSLVAVSVSVKERVKSKFKITKKIDVLYNGLCLKGSVKYKSELADNNNVVFAGTLCENKGIFSLIKAWDLVLQTVPGAKLQIYGKGTINTLNKINQLITTSNKDSIVLKGFVKKEDLPAIYAFASCAIFPSYSETFGMAALEAMAIGCPTIFTKRTSGPEIINHGINGLLVDPDNIEEIANAIIILLTNREQAINMGERAYFNVREKFDISIIADNHIKYYTGIVNKN